MSCCPTTTCKEQCTTCKCIVKERVIDGKSTCKKDDCCPPPDCCKKDCSAVYKQLGCCIQECLMEKCKEAKKKRDCC